MTHLKSNTIQRRENSERNTKKIIKKTPHNREFSYCTVFSFYFCPSISEGCLCFNSVSFTLFTLFIFDGYVFKNYYTNIKAILFFRQERFRIFMENIVRFIIGKPFI